MSIDFHYKKPYEGEEITKEKLVGLLSAHFDIVKVTTNSDGTVNYFAVNPKEKENIVYEDGYEFHLQEDGRYWHPIITREDSLFEKENIALNNIASDLNLELDLDEL